MQYVVAKDRDMSNDICFILVSNEYLKYCIIINFNIIFNETCLLSKTVLHNMMTNLPD